MTRISTFRRDDQGSMSITMAGIMLLLIALTAFFIDLGSMYLTRERLQGAVDSAALKAASDPANSVTLTRQIITDNMPVDPAHITVEGGRYPPAGYTLSTVTALPVAGRFAPGGSNANALRVQARAEAPLYLAHLFGVTDGWVSARAIALNQPVTQIMASTQFADLSALPARIPNALVTALTATATALPSGDYDDLSAASVDILQWLDALIVTAGLDAGAYDDILRAPLTLAEILDAMATAVAADPTQAGMASQTTAILADLRGQWAGLGPLTLDSLIALPARSPEAAAGARIDLFSLVLGTALALNAQGGIAGHGTLAIGGGTADLHVSVVSPPRYSAIGGVGTRVETAQVRLFLDTSLPSAIHISVPPLLDVTADVSLPVYLIQGAGSAEVREIDCPGPEAATAIVHVDATPGLASASIGEVSPAAISSSVPPVSPAGLVAVSVAGIDIEVTAEAHTTISGAPRDLAFTAPFTATNRQAVPLARPADTMTTDMWLGLTPDVTVSGAGLLNGTVAATVGPLVANAVDTLAPLVDQTIEQLQSLFSLDRGYMTVADTFLRCGRPMLAQ